LTLLISNLKIYCNIAKHAYLSKSIFVIEK
jgi:hypothetical protein